MNKCYLNWENGWVSCPRCQDFEPELQIAQVRIVEVFINNAHLALYGSSPSSD